MSPNHHLGDLRDTMWNISYNVWRKWPPYDPDCPLLPADQGPSQGPSVRSFLCHASQHDQPRSAELFRLLLLQLHQLLLTPRPSSCNPSTSLSHLSTAPWCWSSWCSSICTDGTPTMSTPRLWPLEYALSLTKSYRGSQRRSKKQSSVPM